MTGSDRRELLEMLRKYSYRKGEFILSSGRKSNFFIDCKRVILTARGHVLVGKVLLDEIGKFMPVDAVAGVVAGGCPLASAVSTISQMEGNGIDAIYVRRERKDHGTGNIVEGGSNLKKGSKIAILEDVLTTGSSLREAASKIVEAGHIVKVAIVLVDREEGGLASLANSGYPVVAVYNRRDFTDD